MKCNNCQREIGDRSVCPFCQTVQQNTQPYHLPVGTMIGGKYRIESVLGEGGFGVTYLAQDTLLERKVAIKEYFPHGYSYRDTTVSNTVTFSAGSRGEQFARGKARFLNEARTVAKFSNEPGIVDIRDFVEQFNTAYIIMEYLDGETLKERLKKVGRIVPQTIIMMLTPIIAALEKIDTAGVIHRDISPDNIMVLKNGSLKLMDFGAAKEYTSDQQTMAVMLKKGYAPIEQYLSNGKQGPWTDVYALCATIYRCITGKTPDEAPDRINQDPLLPPSQLGVNIPPALEQALLYGLAVHKEDRCPDMKTLHELFDKAIRAYAPRSAPANVRVAPHIPVIKSSSDIPQNRPAPARSIPQPPVSKPSSPSPFGAGLKIWVITMLIGTLLMIAAIPLFGAELSSPLPWLGVLSGLLICLIVACAAVFRTPKSERSKNALIASVVFFSFIFLGVAVLLPLGIFLPELF